LLTRPLAFISTEQQNIILQHHDSVVRQESYLSRHITADLYAAYRGIQPQSTMVRNATSMRLTIDPRRPYELTPTQRAEIECDAGITILKKVLLRFKGQYVADKRNVRKRELLEEAQRTLRREKRAMEKEKLKSIREIFDKEQPVADVERQLRGDSPPTLTPTATQFALPERSMAIVALFPMGTNPETEDEFARRARAIHALKALSTRQESRCHRRGGIPREGDEEKSLSDTVAPLPYGKTVSHPLLCINCLGNQDLPNHQRGKIWGTRRQLKRHLGSCLNNYTSKGVAFPCPLVNVCEEKIADFEHFLLHADTVHGTPTHVRKTFLDKFS
jgi:Protein of unknown function (DUF3435)